MNHATDVSAVSDEHARMLATNWWSGEVFRQRGECEYLTPSPLSLIRILGVTCCEGPFTLAETGRVQDAIRQYQAVRA